MTRPIEDWADRRYAPHGSKAHLVAFGDLSAFCGRDSQDLFGTGSMDEIERAQQLPTCPKCVASLRAKGSDVDPAVATWTQAMAITDTTPPREKGSTC